MKPTAIISCDLDTIDRHLHGYGIEDAAACDAVYRVALPRLLDLLAELELPATLFVIGADAPRHRGVLRRAAQAGHEIASHSMTHPEPFRVLDATRLRREVADSRRVLSDVAGVDVVGFRAPGWDVDRGVLSALVEAGYRYDASLFPSPVLLLNRVMMFAKSTAKGSLFRMDLLGLGSRRPHVRDVDGTSIAEFPVAVTRGLRFPVYHTLSHLLPGRIFERTLDAMIRDAMPFGYQFHACDLLDAELDRLDPRIKRHPGMRLPLAHKLAGLRAVLSRIANARELLTYEHTLAELGMSATVPQRQGAAVDERRAAVA